MKNHPSLVLVHSADELVDKLFAVTQISTLDKMLELAGTETTSGAGKLERPEEM